MNDINRTEKVKEQYKSADNLSTRISIHEKYSTNKTGFGNWIFSNYRFPEGCRVLELGCGTGDMWTGRDAEVGTCSLLVLSDLSEGMLGAAKERLTKYEKIRYEVIDIQDIPYDDGFFDIVIANMMLYHVPDIGRGISEARRVLKSGGSFYCATYGKHGIMEYLSEILGAYGVEDTTNGSFTLQNGERILKASFGRVERLDYEDSLAVTDVDDLIGYLYSLSSMTGLDRRRREDIRGALAQNMTDGVLHVPKEYGMFICG